MGTQNNRVTKLAVSVLAKYPGDTAVVFYIADTKKRFCVPEKLNVSPCDELLTELGGVFGAENVKLH